MFAKIAGFELRYQFRNPVFWVVAILFFLLTFGAITVDQIRIGSGGNVHRNSPVAVFQIHLILSIFFMFVTTAFVANVIVRDDESGFGPMVRSTRVSKFDYLIGRFVGAYLAAAVAFLSIPVAILIGSWMPWLDAETLGANRWEYYAFAYGMVALPNLLLTAAIFFAVATMTRSMMYSYIAVVVFLVGYFVLIGVSRSRPELRDFVAYIEPFGGAAVGSATRYWTSAEANTLVPPITGALLVNRLLAVALAVVALFVAHARFSFAERGVSKRALRKQAKKQQKLAAAAPAIVQTLPPTQPRLAARARMMARIRFEMAQVFKSPAFAVLMLMGLLNAGGAIFFANEIYGTPALPLTFALIEDLIGSFAIIPIIIAIYYAGELVWRDRDRKMHEIIDATSLPNWAYLVPKTLALAGVLFATLLISMIAAMAIQLLRGFGGFDVGQYVTWYLLPLGVDMVLLAILAIFVQALSPNKYVGWAIMVVYLVATLTLSNLGFDHPLYTYGSTGSVRLSDLNGNDLGGAGGWWLRLYWGAVALILAVLAHLLWRRGTTSALMPRLRRVPRGLAGGPGVLIAGALVVAAASGSYIYYNTNVLNEYRTAEDGEKQLADYEKKFLKYETIRQPSVTDVKLKVDLYPAEKRAESVGSYRMVNDTGAPLRDLHVRLFDTDSKLLALDVPGAALVSNDERHKYRIYRFARPLAPGETASLRFRIERWQRGFRANRDDNRMVANGTFLNNVEMSPIIGMGRFGLLSDRAKRRKYGLPPELRPAKLEDVAAQRRNYFFDIDWVRSDITVSTEADQTPIAPGRKIADATSGGRRTAHFVSTAPILMFFSVQSARYAEKTADGGNGVKFSVYYDPRHAYNVDRMLKGMRLALDYYRANFGPYQFDYARIIEFPGYQTFAQAFAGTIPFSEKIGFIADARDPDEIDYVTYVTAHELGHQYWAHQLLSADMQGGTVMVETLAQYSSLMVMKHLYGEEKMRRFLKYELDRYLRSRGSEAVEELPLGRVENQGYIHYQKGSLVMYLMQDRLGEARVNAVLADLLNQYRFKGAPYARSTALIDGLKSLARNGAERQLVSDLFERITVFDLKAKEAKVTKLPDGRYRTVMTVTGDKFYADGKGKETKATLADTIDIGLFQARPGVGAFSAKDVDLIERRPVKSGEQTIVIVSKKKPAFAGVDPYNKYVDRNSDDNLVAVTG